MQIVPLSEVASTVES